jgi:hypothetical protein
MSHNAWQSIETAPFDRDLELSVIENSDTHVLVFRCRRVAKGWINAVTGKPIDVRPTHWREWPPGREGPLVFP